MRLDALPTLAAAALLAAAPLSALADPLPSWTDEGAQARIVAFVESVTEEGGAGYVAPERRIAVFDNDGTLWSEQPVYFQFLYALDAVKAKAEADPSILTSPALKAAAAGDMQALMETGMDGLLEVVEVSHAGVSIEDFQADVEDWLTHATHPTSGLTYAQMTYAPMVELLGYLHDNGFATWIVSGGGVDFIRAVGEAAYGIPPWQVVGSRGNSAWDPETKTVVKTGGVVLIDDKEGKPVGIAQQIGVRPILAFGNSDGDYQMLDYVTSGEGPSLGLLVHHTDAEREFAYDREGHIGVLDKGLEDAEGRGWVIVDMKAEWSRVWSGE
ncbi:HAD family hydrolase [uncultured Albimonas sp.]|uniref:HAD family hydrolase n=1 Tax=uncultured Albimonas sp. TaxID=1331701 RepID=UPI0030ED1783|tara:strand:+ start:1596 stop:2576 length:981 start_codon:yes stop_codon:yes gene_type:complete